MAREVCANCATEKFRRAQVEGENAGLTAAIQRARNRAQRIAKELEAMAATLDARLEASGDRRRGHAIAERAA